jgi:hypothetical protein
MYSKHIEAANQVTPAHFNSLGINTSKNSTDFSISFILKAFKRTRINTSGDKDLKSIRINSSGHKDLKFFRINTSKNMGGGVYILERHRVRSGPVIQVMRNQHDLQRQRPQEGEQ